MAAAKRTAIRNWHSSAAFCGCIPRHYQQSPADWAVPWRDPLDAAARPFALLLFTGHASGAMVRNSLGSITSDPITTYTRVNLLHRAMLVCFAVLQDFVEMKVNVAGHNFKRISIVFCDMPTSFHPPLQLLQPVLTVEHV